MFTASLKFALTQFHSIHLLRTIHRKVPRDECKMPKCNCKKDQALDELADITPLGKKRKDVLCRKLQEELDLDEHLKPKHKKKNVNLKWVEDDLTRHFPLNTPSPKKKN